MWRQVPSWRDLVELIRAGRNVPVRGVLEFSGEMDEHAYPVVYGGQVYGRDLVPGSYRYLRSGGSLRIDDGDGHCIVVSDGDELVSTGMDSPSGTAATWPGGFRWRCPAPAMIDDGCLDRLLTGSFPAGPARPTTFLGRDAWCVPGLPYTARRPYAARRRLRTDDTWAPREMTVDAETGVILSLVRGGSVGEYSWIGFPVAEELDAGDFRWNPVDGEVTRMVERGIFDVVFGSDASAGTSPTRGVPEWPGPDPLFARELEMMQVPAPAPLPDGHRTLQLRTWGGGDWARGKTVGLHLWFEETEEDGQVVTAFAEPVVESLRADAKRYGRRSGESLRRWRSVLRGDGWCAEWESALPVRGWVQLRGTFRVMDHPDPLVIPTRGRIHRLIVGGEEYPTDGPGARPGEDALSVVHRIDVAEISGTLPRYDDPERNCQGRMRTIDITLDLDAAAAPEIPEDIVTPGVRIFGVTDQPEREGPVSCDVLDGSAGRTLWWTADPELPYVHWTDLAGRRSGTATLPVDVTVTRQSPIRIEVDADAGGGRVCCGDLRFRLTRWWNLPEEEVDLRSDGDLPEYRLAEFPGQPALFDVEVPPEPDPAVFPSRRSRPRESGLRKIGQGWFTVSRVDFSGPVTLTRYDGNCEVVQRRHLDPGLTELCGVGPWIGCVASGGGSEGTPVTATEFQLRDPETFEVEMTVPVASGEVCTQWFDGELWIADGRLRVFTQDAAGQWSAREVDV